MTDRDDHRRTHSWTDVPLFPASLARVCVLVHLDGVRGSATLGTTVHHGLNRELVRMDVATAVALADIIDAACAEVRDALTTELATLSPF